MQYTHLPRLLSALYAVQDVRVDEVKLLAKMAYLVGIAFSVILLSLPLMLPVVVFTASVRNHSQGLHNALVHLKIVQDCQFFCLVSRIDQVKF